MEQKRRKVIRLPQFDYSSNGAYFITICTHERRNLFGQIDSDSPAKQMLYEEFEMVLKRFPQMTSPNYVVMPNHFHALIVIDKMNEEASDTVAKMIQAFKSKSTVEYIRLVKAGKAAAFAGKVWQRSYYDHVVRNDRDYQEIWRYIDENPLKWKLDRFYAEE